MSTREWTTTPSAGLEGAFLLLSLLSANRWGRSRLSRAASRQTPASQHTWLVWRSVLIRMRPARAPWRPLVTRRSACWGDYTEIMSIWWGGGGGVQKYYTHTYEYTFVYLFWFICYLFMFYPRGPYGLSESYWSCDWSRLPILAERSSPEARSMNALNLQSRYLFWRYYPHLGNDASTDLSWSFN